MKVLHLGKYFPPYRGGMETYLCDLMVALKQLGIECSALVHRSEISYRSTHESIVADNTPVSVTRAAMWARLVFTPISPTFPYLLAKRIKRDQPDMLHIHMPNISAFWALLLPSARRLPWIVHWHSDVLLSEHSLGLRVFYRVYRPFESAMLRRSSRIIVTSPPYLEASARLAPFRDKCTVVPLGIRSRADCTHQGLERSHQENQTSQSGAAVSSKVTQTLQVLAIGRLTYYKGLQYLIKAIAQTSDTRLDLVGSGEKEAELRAIAASLGVTDRIHFRGNIDNGTLAELLAICDCLCLPSVERTEAFGLVLLEAMSHSKATITSQLTGSGMSWVVVEGVTGLTVPPKDVDALAACLSIFQQDRDNMLAMGKSGRERFDRYFQIDKSAVTVAELYQRSYEHRASNCDQDS